MFYDICIPVYCSLEIPVDRQLSEHSSFIDVLVHGVACTATLRFLAHLQSSDEEKFRTKVAGYGVYNRQRRIYFHGEIEVTLGCNLQFLFQIHCCQMAASNS